MVYTNIYRVMHLYEDGLADSIPEASPLDEKKIP